MGDFIMTNGWVDPTGVIPPVWCGQPEEPLIAVPRADSERFDDAA